MCVYVRAAEQSGHRIDEREVLKQDEGAGPCCSNRCFFLVSDRGEVMDWGGVR